MSFKVIDEVYRIIEKRRDSPQPNSYVSSLMAKGLKAILAKVEEEGGELAEAARNRGKHELIHEAADLIFHTLILLASQHVAAAELYSEFQRRKH